MQPSSFFGTGIRHLVWVAALGCSGPALAANTWSYHQENDRLNNQTYSITVSPMPRRDLYDQLKLEIVCRDNTLQVEIDAAGLIASQGSQFDVEYQIDKQAPVTLRMRTFPDSKRRGYTKDAAKQLVDAILTGQDAIFIRVKTMIREVLSGAIPLQDAAKPVRQVLSDCGMSASTNMGGEPAYGLADFERDFKQLTAAQQRQVLGGIKKIITGVR